jgi:hypothetical protein
VPIVNPVDQNVLLDDDGQVIGEKSAGAGVSPGVIVAPLPAPVNI